MPKVIKVENLSKAYQLGDFGTGTISRDIERAWARLRGKEDPFLKIGEVNNRAVKGTSDVVWSLKDINFEIEQGDAVGIIGRNGAGKSTLLKLLSRVTSPTTGSIKIKGRIASLLEVGTGFHPELTGRENIFLNGAILGMRKAEIKRKFDEIVDFSGVERYIDTPVKRYSSGMYVRLAFAVAAHLESEILVVDEVLAVGDAEFQKKCLGKMGDVSRGEGRTVLFVSHNMDAVRAFCNDLIVLRNGMVDRHESMSNQLINYYLNSFNPTGVTTSEWLNTERGFANPYFAPISLRLIDKLSGLNVDGSILRNKNIQIEIVGEIEILDPALTIGYALFDANESMLYCSYNIDMTEEYWPALDIGKNILTTEIPPNLLNEGKYRLALFASLHQRKWLWEPDSDVPCLFFEVSGSLSESPLWLVKRAGSIAPIIKWEKQ